MLSNLSQNFKVGVLLLQDNVRPHTAALTVGTLRALKFEVFKHPPYSPNLAPLDFHLFIPMKEHLRGHKFADDNEVMEAVQSWSILLNTELNPIYHLLALLGDHHILHVSRIRVKSHAKKLFPRGHPQACGQVDQVCCEAGGGGAMSKNKT
jgi:hypothetical protein